MNDVSNVAAWVSFFLWNGFACWFAWGLLGLSENAGGFLVILPALILWFAAFMRDAS